ncbi:MAG: hypothetical protein Tsb009_34010 [Planctomycetaceae bacterium]
MKQLITSLAVMAILGVTVAIAVNRSATGNHVDAVQNGGGPGQSPATIDVKVEEKNPWTNLRVNNRPKDFQFAIVTDRTGGRRPGVFTRAVEKINLLQPEFVVSVGDLIEGYTEDPGQWALEWSEFESKIEQLQMPFFMCAGNHDITNTPMSDEWKRKFGRTYYHFKYHNVLFLVLNTEDKPAPGKLPYYISPEQQKWAADVLNQNKDVRWTFVILHKPTWTYPNADPNVCGWAGIDAALRGRRYTVFAGHKHQYQRTVIRGREHYMLATTGGASNLSGIQNGRFDHFVWVTMKDNGPQIANLLLDGVAGRNVGIPGGVPKARKRKVKKPRAKKKPKKK